MSSLFTHAVSITRHALYFLSSPKYFSTVGSFGVIVLLLICLCPVPGIGATGKTQSIRGKATWYGTTAQGKRTASGDLFDRNALTAAHRTLPFGTIVRVYNLKNGRSVLVKINDRGPFSQRLILDLSRRAAEQLHMINAGVAPVSYEIVADRDGRPANANNSFYLHLTNESDALKADALSRELSKKLRKPVHALRLQDASASAQSLCLGPYPTFAAAHRDLAQAEGLNLGTRGIVEAPTRGAEAPLQIAGQTAGSVTGKPGASTAKIAAPQGKASFADIAANEERSSYPLGKR